MREFYKVLCLFVMMAAVVGAAIAWRVPPSPLVWGVRIGSVAVGLAAVGCFAIMHFRRDLAPDFLHKYFGSYFDRGGFCFSFTMLAENGACVLVIPFQNRHERECSARITIRPARGYYGARQPIRISFEIEAEPAAFGIARVPIRVPANYQGKKQRFEVTADVKYPNGKGRMLRFRDGIAVRSEGRFAGLGSAIMTILITLSGHIHLSAGPASVVLQVPSNVLVDLPPDTVPVVKTFWKLGDAEGPDSATMVLPEELRSG